MLKPFSINSRKITTGQPTYIIAELSGNHNQNFDTAVKLIELAHDAGVDAVKLQTYTADTITIDSDRDYFKIEGTLWEGRTLYNLYQEAYTPWEWQPKLKQIANDLGMDLFSSAFDFTAVDFLEEMDVSAHKIASFENVDIPLIRKIAQTGKPTIMSTGMATMADVDNAVRAFFDAGGQELALLKCTSAYPTPPEATHLMTIPHLMQTFDVPVGLSDHTLGTTAPVISVSLGACIIEKHLTLSRAKEGVDNAFSLEPHEFKELVDAVRLTEKMLGTVRYSTPEERESKVFRRSLFVVEDVQAGEPFTSKNVRSIRPGHGLPPQHIDDIIGKVASQDIQRGTPVSWDFITSESSSLG